MWTAAYGLSSSTRMLLNKPGIKLNLKNTNGMYPQRVRNASDLIIFGGILEAFQIRILFNIPTNSSIKNIK